MTVGFALAAATKESAAANPDIEYVLIDDSADGGEDGQTFDGKADVENIKPLLYNTAEAAFLAGYAAADYTKTGKVGTYGGMPFPTLAPDGKLLMFISNQNNSGRHDTFVARIPVR